MVKRSRLSRPSRVGGARVIEERKEEPGKKRYRAPKPGTKEGVRVARFKEAGIDIRIEDVEPGEHRLLFFGTVPEAEPEEEEETK
jgi:hypothetical protein